MANDKPGEVKVESQEQKNIAHVASAANDRSMAEVLATPQVVAKVADTAKLTDAAIVASGDSGIVAKTAPEQYIAYAQPVSRMPEDGIGSQKEAQAVVAYFKDAYPMNAQFNAGVEKAVFT